MSSASSVRVREESYCSAHTSTSQYRRNLQHFALSAALPALWLIHATLTSASSSFIGRGQNYSISYSQAATTTGITLKWRSQNYSSSFPSSTTVNFGSTADGDELILFAISFKSQPTAPAGWNTLSCGATYTSTADYSAAFYKTWHSGDPTSVTIGPGLDYPKAIVRDYRNVAGLNTCTAYPAVPGSNTWSASATIPALSATSIAGEGYVALFASDGQNGTITGPADLSHTVADGSQWDTFDGDKIIANAGTTPGAQKASLPTDQHWMGYAITLIPNTSATPTPTPTPTSTPAITFQWRSQNYSSSFPSSTTVNFGSTADGDELILFAISFKSQPTAPAGWNTLSCGATYTSTADYSAAFYKTWHSGDPRSVTIGPSLDYPKAIVRDYRNVAGLDTCTAYPAVPGSNTWSTSATIPALSATSVAQEWYVALFANDGQNDTITGPADLSRTVADGSQWDTFDGNKSLPNAGTTPGSQTASLPTDQHWMGYAITLRPKRSATPTPTPTSSPTPTPTRTPTPSPTPTPTATPSPTPTSTRTPTPSPTPTSSPTPTPTVTPTPGDPFSQFSTSGTILNSYTPGSSLWLRTMYYGYFTEPGLTVSDFQAAGMNAWEGGVYPFLPGDYETCINQTTFALDISCFESSWPSSTWWGGLVSEYASTGIPDVVRDDNTYVSDNNNADPSYAQSAQYINQYMKANSGNMIVAQIGRDETPNNSSAVPCFWGNMLDAIGLGFTGDSTCGSFSPTATAITTTPFAHIPFGPDPDEGSGTVMFEWLNNPTVSDFGVYETGGQAQNGGTTGWLQDMLGADGSFATVTAARGATPGYLVGGCMGYAYYKLTNDTQYTPGVDEPVSVPGTPAVVAAQTMFAVAHGYAGMRVYGYDGAWASSRPSAPVCTQAEINADTCSYQQTQTGCSSIGAHASIGSIGQDRWYGLSAAYNLIKTIEPYALQPMTTPPAGGCASFSNCSSGGIITGAHSGTVSGVASNLVVIENFSDSSASYSYNPSAYLYSGGEAESWKIVASDSPACGAQSTLPSVSDCGIGATQVIGATTVSMWTDGSTFPAPGAAPTTTTMLNMQPLEVDVFLYHQ